MSRMYPHIVFKIYSNLINNHKMDTIYNVCGGSKVTLKKINKLNSKIYK